MSVVDSVRHNLPITKKSKPRKKFIFKDNKGEFIL